MAVSLNSKQNIAFTGLKQDIEVSRQIVSGFHKELGRPKSNTFVEAKIYQHIDDEKYTDISIKLTYVKDKYSRQIFRLREELKNWLKMTQYTNSCLLKMDLVKTRPVITLDEYMKKVKELVSKVGAANCEEYSDIVQYDHLKKGINANVVGVCVYSKYGDKFLRNHSFCVRSLAQGAEVNNPSSWGDKAIVADAWLGTGVVDKAKDTLVGTVKNGEILHREYREGGLSQILKFIGFNPDKEKLRYFNCNKIYSQHFIQNMKKQ